MWQEVGWTDDSLLGLWEEQVVQPKLKAFLVFLDSHGPHLPRAQKMVEHHNPWIVPSQTVVAQRVSPKYDLWHDADIERVRLLHRPTIRLSSTEIQNHLSRQPNQNLSQILQSSPSNGLRTQSLKQLVRFGNILSPASVRHSVQTKLQNSEYQN